MRATKVVCLLAFAALTGAAHGAEIEGVTIADRITLSASGPELVLNGAGVRHKLGVMKVYIGGLYLAAKTSDRDAILADAGPKRIFMQIVAEEVTGEEMIASMNGALHDNIAPAEYALIDKRVRALNAAMTAAKTLNRGTIVFLDYLPGTGTRFTVNGEEKLTIAGDDFFRAMLRIWLGNKPVDGRLRDAMLGGSSSFFRLF
jgi:hypothetical protein